MDYTNTLGLVLPTNEPDVAFDYILSSLDNFVDCKDFVTFLINFQKPWTNEQINKAVSLIKEKGFAVEYAYNEYIINGVGMIPINKMRNDAAILKKCKFYALVDDDMVFIGPSGAVNSNGGRQYLEVINYMVSHPKCGITLIGGSLVRKVPKYCIAPVDIVNTYVTGKGFITRAFKENGAFIPNDALELVGGDEEKLLAARVLYAGLYPAKMGFGKIRHYENHGDSTKGKLTCGTAIYHWDRTIYDNNLKYIREHYNPYYGPNNRKYNDCEPHANDVVQIDTYLKNGGLNVYDKNIVESNTVDYSNISTNDLIDQTKKLLGE